MINARGKHKALLRQCQTRRLLPFFAVIIINGVTFSAAFAQPTRQQLEFQDTNRQIQQELDTQQRNQQMQFEMNQMRGQQMRQQQLQPMPPPSIGIVPQQRRR